MVSKIMINKAIELSMLTEIHCNICYYFDTRISK